jgi:hypothetical protein
MDDCRLIPLTKGKFAIVDAADFDFLNQWKWNAGWRKNAKKFYAYSRRGGKQEVAMHRLILGVTDPNELVDHRDNDGLNNRRLNLRQATRSQNGYNRGAQVNSTSGLKGVRFHKGANKWMAEIYIEKKHIYLGLFETPELAHERYIEAAKEGHGEFAYAVAAQ